MGPKKHKPTAIEPPKPEDFIPKHPPSGVCLLCDEWLGLNCDDHDYTKEPDAKHFPKSGPPFTPHIIISPLQNDTPVDSDEDEPENQPKVDPSSETVEETSTESPEGASVGNKDGSPESPSSESHFHFPENISVGDIILEEEQKSPDEVNSPQIPTNGEAVSFQGDLQFYDNQQDFKTDYMPNNQGTAENEKHIQAIRNENSGESLLLCLSALYGKLIVVMGMAFPIAEIISSDVPLVFYNIFYLFLYFTSILFLIYAYLFLLRVKSLPMSNIKTKRSNFKIPVPNTFRQLISKKKATDVKSEKGNDSLATAVYKTPKYTLTESSNHGSMYLKMGAVVFGVGSMIYSGLEFGQYFELLADSECGNFIMAITPIARMLFTFLQMYFIFLNSRVAISKSTNIARFGLMHMIATNLCIWQSVLVQETKHEISHLVEHASIGSKDSHSAILGELFTGSHEVTTALPPEDSFHHVIEKRAAHLDGTTICRRTNLMGAVVNSASPFLFPCTIEYSLLCAGVLYVMWKNINALKAEKSSPDADSDISNFIARKVRHHYSVDCARASRGLFMGIFVLVLTIISLILFYVLISNEDYKEWAIMEANIIEVTIYSMAIGALMIGMKQMRQLEFISEGDIELDNILLLIAQGGVYIYTSFTIIGACFSLKESPMLPMITAILTLGQTTLQTIFILDGSRRCCYTAEQHDRKPGRELVTFLLVCNLAMWAISTFETSRADAHPVQMDFYGIWAWTIISHVSMPLAIFYRFHVTVCLGEIWKRAYKVKQDFFAL